MKKRSRKIGIMPLVIALGTMAAGTALRFVLKSTWRGVSKREPPSNHKKQQHASLWETVLWTTISGVVTAFSNLIVKRAGQWVQNKQQFSY